MQDKIIKLLGLFTTLSLALFLIGSTIVLDTASSYAQTSSLQWTQIPIPAEDNMQLYPRSDIGPMAVSPDSMTVFAAVLNESSGKWDLLKSTDGAYTWKTTGLSAAMAAKSDDGEIVGVKLSPSWSSDSVVFVATNNSVYYSEDSGHTFDATVAVPGTIYAAGTDVITSLTLGLDSSDNLVAAVGTMDPTAAVGGDVYISNVGAWAPLGVGTYDVLAVGLSPNYATDKAIIAVVTDTTKTMVRTKLGTGPWGDPVFDATIKDQNGLDFPSYKACIGLPDNYKAASGGVITLFVGLSAVGPRGDVFGIYGGWLSAPTVADLNVRGYANPPTNTIPTETNIWSIAVSGGAASATIIVGTEALNLSAPPAPPGQFLVYASSSSGGNWSPSYSDYLSPTLSYKQPTGEIKATVVMASSVAYVGTRGNQSAVSAASNSQVGGYITWNQRGLIDTLISEITDMCPSDAYFSDGTMYITTQYAGTASLWFTASAGSVWERVYCSTLTGPATCVFDMVRFTTDAVILAQSGSKEIVPSFDGGKTFQVTRGSSLMDNISAFAVENGSIYYTGTASGSVSMTTDQGATWASSNGSDIPVGESITDLVLTDNGDIYAGTDGGGVYKASTSDFTFVQVGPDTPGVPGDGDIVHVAPDLYDGSYVYAGIQGGVRQGVWRFDQSDTEAVWEQIADVTTVGNISSLACDEESGVLYVISSTSGTGYRWVKPAAETVESPDEIDKGLNAGDSVKRGLKSVSGPTLLFAVGGSSYTQIWTTSDQMVKMKLLAPADGSIAGTILEDKVLLGQARVMLKWQGVDGADSYEVKVTTDENLSSPVDISYYDGGTTYANGMVKVVYPWLGTRYYWSVRVIAPYLSQWADAWSFITPLGPAPAIPGLLSPQPGQTNVILKPVLQWNSSVAATGYELILAANCDWNNPVLNLSGGSKVSETAYQLTFNLAKNTSYCWKVRGVNNITNSPWSDTGAFTTGSTGQVENGGLPVLIWVIIALGSLLILSIVVLTIRSRMQGY